MTSQNGQANPDSAPADQAPADNGDVKLETEVIDTGKDAGKDAGDKGKTIVDTLDDDVKTAPGDFPADWREKLVGDVNSAEGKKTLKMLQRFTSPKALSDAYIAANQKIRSGELKAPLPENPTEEQLRDWRADNGIPETPEGYDIKIDGVVIGEEDKPLVDQFLKEMHGVNATPQAVKSAIAAYYKIVDGQQAELAVLDKDMKKEALAELQSEWGEEYRPNLTLFKNYLDTLPNNLKDRLLGGRTADGRIIGDDPDLVRWMTGLAKEFMPAGANVPGTGTVQMANLQAEKKALEAKQGTTNYTDADRKRYIELIEFEQQLGKRNAA